MPENFRTLAELLGPAPSERVADSPCDEDDAIADCGTEDTAVWGEEMAELAREVRLFRAHVAEAVDAALETLLADIAAEVLARELLLAPVDVQQIVERAVRRFDGERTLRIRVHPDEVQRVESEVPVIADSTLRRGDAAIELCNGSVDVSLGVRLEAVLRANS